MDNAFLPLTIIDQTIPSRNFHLVNCLSRPIGSSKFHINQVTYQTSGTTYQLNSLFCLSYVHLPGIISSIFHERMRLDTFFF